jgi:hypothetical protein
LTLGARPRFKVEATSERSGRSARSRRESCSVRDRVSPSSGLYSTALGSDIPGVARFPSRLEAIEEEGLGAGDVGGSTASVWPRRKGPMEPEDLFELYRASPRDPSLAPKLFGRLRAAWRWTLLVFAGAMALGVPLSFVQFHKIGSTAEHRTWEPMDIPISGLILAVFTVPIVATFIFVFRRYTAMFRAGRLVEAVVVGHAGSGALVRVAAGPGPDMTFIPSLSLPIGTRLPAIVGAMTGSLVLVVAAREDVRQGSLLTPAQVEQVAAQQGAPVTG